MSELRERLPLAIKNRDDIKSQRLSVSKLLRLNDMENYIDVCCSRIVNEKESDDLEAQGIEVNMSMTLDQYDVLLTSDAVLENKEILLGYVPLEILKDAFTILCNEEWIDRKVNSIAEMLRNINMKDIVKGLLKMIVQRKEPYEGFWYYYCLELFCRSHLWNLIKRIREMKEDTYRKIRCKRIVTEFTKQTNTAADE